VAKPNYQFEKRQRDIAKKKQQDEKRQKKQSKNPGKEGEAATPDAPETPPAS
jgi:hypothetical protein